MRSILEAWRDPKMVEELANLLKDSLLSELRAALEKNTKVIEQLEAALKEKDEKIGELEAKLEEKTDSLEQYQRRACFRIFGVPETENEDTDAIAVGIAAEIGVEFDAQDIDRSCRVGKKVSNHVRSLTIYEL